MIIIDTELRRRHEQDRPIQAALIGAGYMARGYGLQLLTAVTGVKLAVIANRNHSAAVRIFADSGVKTVENVNAAEQLDEAIARRVHAVTDDALVACRAKSIDVVIEATGEVEFGARVVMEAIKHGKHVILSNAELDATLGPILKVYADRAGVVITNTDGDEPGVAMNLFRFAKSVGCRPVLAGNLKGFIDYHRTPETQAGFAAKNYQSPRMATSFADGTKLSMETTILANATGLRVARRGMHGHRCSHVNDVLKLFSPDELSSGGFVEYLLGAEPGTGAFVVGFNDEPIKQQYMAYFKMGPGPLYVFYTPYHLPHLQLPHTLARAVLFQDPTVTPIGPAVCEVVTIAKRGLKAGEELDGIGGFTCYGSIENAVDAQAGDLLPMGVSGGCRLKADVDADREIRYCDVELPTARLCDQLMIEQDQYFGVTRGVAARARGMSSTPAAEASCVHS
jgi:predicted homoserine dehydrogenase-like protein